MTQTAVSYQVKLLEENIGEPLFLRRPRQISLTDAGERGCAEGDGSICCSARRWRRSARRVEDADDQHHATFASHWLARNFGSFQLASEHRRTADRRRRR
jgi:LysR family glycine cleavage system transcriptional activator